MNEASCERNGHRIGGAGECREAATGTESITPYSYQPRTGRRLNLITSQSHSSTRVRIGSLYKPVVPVGFKRNFEIPTTMHYSGLWMAQEPVVGAFIGVTGNPVFTIEPGFRTVLMS